MEKTYDPKTIEANRYQDWEDKNHFKPQGKNASYCIMLPPPNVTGTLHMGHGFQHALMDVLTRYHRMMGDNTLWQAGVDHAGIATQMVVERQLAAKNQTRHDLGREKFVEKIWDWKEQSGNTITEQMRRMGSSVDWPSARFTMDDDYSDAVLDMFIKLYDEGLIYRGKRLVNWDPVLHTAISDLEVENQEKQGHLWHIRYPLKGSNEHLVVATTRPETLLGDTAVAVHPDDERYRHLIGQEIELPLTNRIIKIIADDYVDREFGSGCVKITPAHDFNDYEMGKRHKLEMINILTPDAKLNDNAPEAYRGLDRFDARKCIVKDLKDANLLEKTDDHTLTIPVGDRSGAVIEPYLTDQWYMRMAEIAAPALQAVRDGKIRFIPNNWTNTYNQWLENIQDWCISRQLWWGHRIPAWYDQDNKLYVGHSEQAVREKHQLDDNIILHQDEDVLDTWVSSSLWPFATLGWPKDTERYKTFFPTQTLVTGFDIIFFWVARMIMMSLKFTGEVPFSEVYITGLIRDHFGKKMSKTKGNVLDPIDLIDGIDLESLIKKRCQGLMQPQMIPSVEKHTREEFPDGIKAFGTDALRFTYCALATTGRDIRFDMSRLEGYRNFCNKIWNAARFVFMNTEEHAIPENKTFSPADKWILSRLQQTIQNAHEHLKTYRFDLLAQCLYDFVWNGYCDWYLELVKPVLHSDGSTPESLAGTRHTLLNVLETLLRLLHPIMPFITDEIWQRAASIMALQGDTIMLQAYPTVNTNLINTELETDITWLQTIITQIRTLRAEMAITPGKKITALFHKATEQEQQKLTSYTPYLTTLAKLDSFAFTDKNTELPKSATTLLGNMEIMIPMAGLIDKDAELKRLDKEIEKITGDIKRFESKLQNPNYVNKAPPAVVEQEKTRLNDANLHHDKLLQQREDIATL